MKRIVTYIVALTAIAVVLSCGKKRDNSAALAAEKYMNYMVSGQAEKYVSARSDYDSLPDNYRNQLVTMVKQYIQYEQKERGGIKTVSVISDTIDGNTANVLLSVHYGNGNTEELLFPLIKRKNAWKIP
jgi:pyruvate-formate lyase